MTHKTDMSQAQPGTNEAPTSRAKEFVRQHRFALLSAGLLAALGVAGIAHAHPATGHSSCCMAHHHDQPSASTSASTSTNTSGKDPSGKITITVDDHGFQPSSIEVPKGQKTILEFRRTSDKTCATSVVFPELKIEKALPLNQTVAIELPANVSSPLTFQCGMGMYHGKVVAR